MVDTIHRNDRGLMNVLVACEFSGRVRDAFILRGHAAVSCDLLDSETKGPHCTGDVRDRLLYGDWDLMIAHPPCTYLAVSGAKYFKDRQPEQKAALEFVQMLMDAPIPKIAIENPVSVISTKIRKPDQYIQPWMFGHGEQKKTGLWLKGLPKLVPTDIVEGREQNILAHSPSKNRQKNRSRTYLGIAKAMAEQWG